jgi:small conductance mechanosensitive channel
MHRERATMTTAAEQLWSGLAAEINHLRSLTPEEIGLNAILSVGAVVIGAVLIWLSKRLLCYSLRVIPGLDRGERKAHAKKALRLTQWILNIAIVLVALFAVFEIWGFNPLGWTATAWGRTVSATGSQVAMVVVISALALEASTLFIQYVMARLKARTDDPRRAAQLNTLGPIFRSAFQIVVILLAAMTLLGQIGVRIGPILAGAGVVGVAVGFGAQTLVKDFFTGFFLIIEDIVAVGDVVQIQGFSGTVEEMTLRTIRLRDFDGTLHVFPYGEAQIIHNMTKTFSFSAFDVPVRADTDLDKAMAVMRKTFADMRKDDGWGPRILDDIEIAGVDLLSDVGIILKGRIRTRPQARWDVLREYYRRLKGDFEAAGIVLTHK